MGVKGGESPSLGQAGASRMCLHELLSSLSLDHKLDPAATGEWMLQASKESLHLFFSH